MYSKISFLLLACIGLLGSCNNGGNTGDGKPIVLGDPSTIVTETDSQYLQDFVTDIKLVKPTPAPPPVETAPAKDTATKPAEPTVAAQQEPQENGLNVPFKEATAFIPGIEVRNYGNKDVTNANGASYEITEGKLQGNELRILKGDIDKVSQRYQTVVVAKNELGVLVLESLSEISEWKPVSGKNNVYSIKGLTTRELAYERASRAAIRNAVTKAVRNARMSKAMQNKWTNSLKNVRSVNQKPLTVALRSVMWKIEGKDASGKRFQKQLRIDIPL